MEPKGQSSFSEQLAICPSTEPDQSGPRPASFFLEIHCNIIHQSMPSSSTWFFPSVIPNKTLICLFYFRCRTAG